MMNLGVIMGGMSTEHYVSIVSGTSIVNNLNKKKYKIFPIYIDLKGNWYKYIKPIEEIDKPLEEYIFSEMNYSLNVIKPIMQQLDKVINEEAKVYLEGTNKVFELPEFKSLEVAKNFVNLIDTKQVMLDLLNTGFAKDINVYIGDENENEQLKDFSIITFKHRYQDKDLGTIGIIGPKRMDYSKVISVMKYISKKLNGQ